MSVVSTIGCGLVKVTSANVISASVLSHVKFELFKNAVLFVMFNLDWFTSSFPLLTTLEVMRILPFAFKNVIFEMLLFELF